MKEKVRAVAYPEEYTEPLPSFYYNIEAWINYDEIVLNIDTVSVTVPIADLLEGALAVIDDAKHSGDKLSLINHLLPLLQNAVSELEQRRAAEASNA